jgi:hypothetical protein
LPSLPYDPNAQNYQIANWVDLLNAANSINFQISLSATNQNAVINQVIIAYQCWDATTGASSTDCQLALH